MAERKIYVGLHFYCKKGRDYAVYKYDHVSEDGKSSSASFVDYFDTQEEARRETYRLNGWGQPKQSLYAKRHSRT